MTDIYDSAKRSALMSRVRGAGNRSTELRLIEIFRAFSIVGWRRKQRLPGRPDFVFRRERVVIFVDGCFWHCCPSHGTHPKSNTDFWRKKLTENVSRDRLVSRKLRRSGWQVLRLSAEAVVQEATDLQGRWSEMSPDEKRDIVESIVQSIIVDKDKQEIEITLSCLPTSVETANTQQHP